MLLRRAACAAALAFLCAQASAETLSERVRSFLTGALVTRARRVNAVAAVRGSAPKEQEEDLDQFLLDGIAAQRAAAEPDRAALKHLYEALGVSYAVQSYSEAEDAELRGQAGRELSAWARAPRSPAPPASLISVLSNAPTGLDEKTLVKSGWGRYVRSIRPGTPPAAAAASSAYDPQTAALDEQLEGLRGAWLSRELSSDAKARALLLASQVSSALGSAPLKLERAERADAGASEVSAILPDSTEPAVDFVPRRVYDSSARSVVVLIASDPGGAGELGTGSVIDAKSRVLTNAHVVIRDSTRQPWPKLRAYFKPEKMTGDPKADLAKGYPARVVSYDRGLDLALVEIDGGPSAPALPLADPPSLSVGDRVAAIGHPEQGGLWTLTTGVLSSLVADIGGVKGKHVFQTDASINRGNSGGPLLDGRGRIVGVNTLMSRKAADGLAITSVNFAVRSDVAARWLRAKAGVTAAGAPAASPPAVVAAATKPAELEMPAQRNAKIVRPTAKPKKETITESKPFKRDALIERAIREMEDLESELREEVRKKR